MQTSEDSCIIPRLRTGPSTFQRSALISPPAAFASHRSQMTTDLNSCRLSAIRINSGPLLPKIAKPTAMNFSLITAEDAAESDQTKEKFAIVTK